MQTPEYASGFWNPYVAGVALGLVLLLSFYLMGTGLGASGALVRTAAVAAHQVAPDTVEQNAYFKSFFKPGKKHPLMNRIVFMVIGVFLGGLVGVLTARRFKPEVGRGPTASVGLRLTLAFVGGILGGVGTPFRLRLYKRPGS